jgi:hypothetical protein
MGVHPVLSVIRRCCFPSGLCASANRHRGKRRENTEILFEYQDICLSNKLADCGSRSGEAKKNGAGEYPAPFSTARVAVDYSRSVFLRAMMAPWYEIISTNSQPTSRIVFMVCSFF